MLLLLFLITFPLLKNKTDLRELMELDPELEEARQAVLDNRIMPHCSGCPKRYAGHGHHQ